MKEIYVVTNVAVTEDDGLVLYSPKVFAQLEDAQEWVKDDYNTQMGEEDIKDCVEDFYLDDMEAQIQTPYRHEEWNIEKVELNEV